LPSKYTKIVGIGVGKRHLLIFFFTPIPTQHPKGVQMGLARKKNKKNVGVLMKSNYIISIARLGAKLEDAA
jgi:hypothetical protein